jgi:protein transport protein HofC
VAEARTERSSTDEARYVADVAAAIFDGKPDLEPAHLERSSRPEPWRLRHLMYVVAIAAVVLAFLKMVVGSAAAVVIVILGGLVLLFIMAMGTGVVLAWAATTKQSALLHILAIAAESAMPLAPAIAAFSDQYRGLAHRRIMNLAARLNWGTTLAEALQRSHGIVSRDAVLLAWAGQETGLLSKALRMAADVRSSQLPIWTSIASRIAYILALLLGMQGISGFILYFIVPKFEAIYKDFNVGLPGVTIMVIGVSHFLTDYRDPVALLPLAELGLLILIPVSFLGWGSYSVPVFDRLLHRRHTALVLRCLSLFVEGGKPIELGFSTLASHYPTYWVRGRLRRADAAVRGGLNWIDALRKYRLIRASDAAVLASAEAVGNLAWALSELAVTAERRLTIWFQLVTQILFPLVVMMLGILVFILAVAYFLPLVGLIQALS